MPIPRETLERLCRDRNVDFSTLSRLVGRNPAYIQQYIKRGTPRELAEKDRRTIAEFFGVDERELGGPDRGPSRQRMIDIVRRPVRAAAGYGGINEHEVAEAAFAFDHAMLRTMTRTPPDQLSVIGVQGDSMHPTLSNGDDILVDQGDAADRLRDGIYVLRIEDGLVVKRLALHPLGRTVTVQSDNPAHADWPGLELDKIDVVGRVLWAGRRVL